MSGVIVNQVRVRFYLDSVALMRISAEVAVLPGVEEAALMIGSPSNRQIMSDAGLLASGSGESAAAVAAAGPNDLIIGVRAADHDAANAALDAAMAALDAKATGGGTGSGSAEFRPRTLAAACEQLPEANLALISVAGEFAAAEASRALGLGLNVMLFSDNVSVDDEVLLKRRARDAGLLVMGPDCGTAFIGGTPLAFANAVARGNIGAVAASGTGLQEFSVLLTRAGLGLSHGIGVGGRDLSDAVGGISTLTALDWLEQDTDTDSVVLISKPPGPTTQGHILERLSRYTKPLIVCFLGAAVSTAWPDKVRAATTLRELAELAAEQTIGSHFVHQLDPPSDPKRRWLRGLYSGGTLCAEAQVILSQAGLTLRSNAPIPGVTACQDDDRIEAATAAHLLLDLGADEYTLGRPHPMIEPAARNEVFDQALADPTTAAVLFDLVLGFGAHPDPAAGLCDVLDRYRTDPHSQCPALIASVCGVAGDPQGYDEQVEQLEQAGVVVAPSNAHAAELALRIVSHHRR